MNYIQTFNQLYTIKPEYGNLHSSAPLLLQTSPILTKLVFFIKEQPKKTGEEETQIAALRIDSGA